MYRIVLYAVIYLPITSANPLTPPHPRFRSSLFPPLSFSFSLSLFFPFFFFSSFLFFSFLFFPPSLSLCVFVFIPIDHPFVSFPFLFLFFLSFVYLLRSPRFTLSTTTVPLATIRSLAFYTGQEDSYFFSYLTLSSCIGSAGHFFFFLKPLRRALTSPTSLTLSWAHLSLLAYIRFISRLSRLRLLRETPDILILPPFCRPDRHYFP